MALSALQLLRAVQAGESGSVRRALGLNPALVHAKHPKDAHTALHAAAAKGDLQLLRQLLQLGASFLALDINNETPLHVAARQGHAAVVKELLTDAGRRSCLKATNRDGATPLHLAVAARRHDVVQLLVNAGARVDLRDRAGQTPLDLVSQEDGCQLADILVAGRQLTPTAGRTARHVASPAVSPARPAAAPAPAPVPGQEDAPGACDAPAGEEADAGWAVAPPSGPQQLAAGGGPPDAQAAAPRPTAAAGEQLPAATGGAHEDPAATTAVDAGGQAHSWLQFSPEMAVGAAEFRQHRHQLPRPAVDPDSPQQVRDSRRQLQHQLQQAAEPPLPLPPHHSQQPVPSQGSAASSAWAAPPAATQPHLTQLNHSAPAAPPPPFQLGPLHSARGAGPLAAGAAAAAAAGEAARSCVSYGARRSLSGSAPWRQASSGGAAVAPGHAADPQASTMHESAAHHAAAAAGLLGASRPISLGGGSNGHPGSLPNTPSFSQLQPGAAPSPALPGPCLGPLHQPLLQAQVGDLAGRVHQLEAWFQAQLELIPEWQRVLGVVQAVKQQLEAHQQQREELGGKVALQQASLEHLLASVESLEATCRRQEGAAATAQQQGEQLSKLARDQAAIMAELGEQMGRLNGKVVRLASSDAVADRLAALEAGQEALRARLHHAEQSFEAACGGPGMAPGQAPGGAAAAEERERLAALEAGMADLRVEVARLQQEAAPRSQERAAAEAAVAPPHGAWGEVEQLKQRVAELSALVCRLASGSPGGGVEEDQDQLLQFMESTSGCLQQHEEQLGALQALVPKVESVVAQRAQVCELMQQMAALQTTFHLLTNNGRSGGGGGDTSGSRGATTPPRMAARALGGSAKAAADYYATATSMVKLQSQMGVLSAAVEQLQLEWEAAATSMRAEHETIREAWDAARARLEVSEREAVRRLADLHKDLQLREDRLVQIREAALAEEAARRSQLDSEARVGAMVQGLQGLHGQHEQLKGRLAGLADTTAAMQEQLGSLEAEVQASLQEMAPQLEALLEAQKAGTLSRRLPSAGGGTHPRPPPSLEHAAADDDSAADAALKQRGDSTPRARHARVQAAALQARAESPADGRPRRACDTPPAATPVPAVLLPAPTPEKQGGSGGGDWLGGLGGAGARKAAAVGSPQGGGEDAAGAPPDQHASRLGVPPASVTAAVPEAAGAAGADCGGEARAPAKRGKWMAWRKLSLRGAPARLRVPAARDGGRRDGCAALLFLSADSRARG